MRGVGLRLGCLISFLQVVSRTEMVKILNGNGINKILLFEQTLLLFHFCFYFLKNRPKVLPLTLAERYLEASQTSMMELFCGNR